VPDKDAPQPEQLLEEQIAYYRARAAEYDEWVYRNGRYDHGPAANQQWRDELAEVSQALADFAPKGPVLELAAGTGHWTGQLLQQAETVTVVDAAPEMIAINRARHGGDRIRYQQGDIFAFGPTSQFDVVFFGFWLSHVPPERFAGFWNLVGRCLKPGGRVFFVDSLYNPVSTARDQRLEGPEKPTTLRRLNDGREFRIVKVFYPLPELAARLAELGWDVDVRATASHFVYGFGGLRVFHSVARS
jgi:SAM-dependent methyltransferase